MRYSLKTLLIALTVAIMPALVLTACSLPFNDDETSSIGNASASDIDDVPAVMLDDAGEAPDFTLTDHEGQPFSLSDHQGQLVAIFFGYTGCPDICPMTLGYMAQATEALGDDADQVQYLLITVDPDQDDPDRLAQYISRIDAPLAALTGSQDDLEPVWEDYDITVERRDREGGSGYLIDHSAQVWLIDDQGDLIGFMPMGADGDDLTAALRWLLDREA